MKKHAELEETLQRLDESAKKIIKTRGYTKEVDKIKALEEMIKEQLLGEDTRSAIRQTR